MRVQNFESFRSQNSAVNLKNLKSFDSLKQLKSENTSQTERKYDQNSIRNYRKKSKKFQKNENFEKRENFNKRIHENFMVKIDKNSSFKKTFTGFQGDINIKRGGLRAKSAVSGIGKKVMSSKHTMFRHVPSSSSFLVRYGGGAEKKKGFFLGNS